MTLSNRSAGRHRHNIINLLKHNISVLDKGDHKMKKKFKMQDVDCANCAAKMEEAIKKIDGVNDASVSFMAQKLSIDADDERFDEIMQEAQRVVQSIEPDTSIVL